MEISWLGHSCFKISHKGYSVVIDPYDLTNANYPVLSTTRFCAAMSTADITTGRV